MGPPIAGDLDTSPPSVSSRHPRVPERLSRQDRFDAYQNYRNEPRSPSCSRKTQSPGSGLGVITQHSIRELLSHDLNEELQWPDLKLLQSGPTANRWESHVMPEELGMIPDDDPPQDLVETLRMSLSRNQAPESAEAESTTLNQASEQGDITEFSASETGRLSPADERSFADVETGRDSKFCSLSGQRSNRSRRESSERRSSKTSHLTASGNLLSSALDLFNSVVGRPDGNSPQSGSKLKGEKIVATVECTCCFDDIRSKEVRVLPCSHSYCKPCLKTMITTAMQVESSFPPKCCLTEIPLPAIMIALDAVERDKYREKVAEYSIPAGKRWYCPNTKCSRWIKPSKLHRFRSSNQTCPHCSITICSICRGLEHDKSTDCPQDFGLTATLEVAESEGWQRCYSCRTMVELQIGCHHITCRCGAQFCYVCGLKWKTCNCNSTSMQARQRNLREQRQALQQQRRARNTLMQLEADEMARAVYEAEVFERQQEEQRRVEEAWCAKELARLEEERLQEEQRKREEEKEMERQRVETIKTSIGERAGYLVNVLNKISQFQQLALTSRHEMEQQILVSDFEQEDSYRRENAEKMTTRILTNIEKRTKSMQDKHQAELQALVRVMDSACDDIFINVQIFLPGKLDREELEKRANKAFIEHYQREIKKVHEEKERARIEERQKAEERQKLELQALEQNNRMEREGVDRSNEIQQATATSQHHARIESLGKAVCADRMWFEWVTKRRFKLLESHFTQMLHDLDAGRDPTGLTEQTALGIMPLPSLENKNEEDAESCKGTQASTEETTRHNDSGLPATSVPASDVQDASLSGESSFEAAAHKALTLCLVGEGSPGRRIYHRQSDSITSEKSLFGSWVQELEAIAPTDLQSKDRSSKGLRYSVEDGATNPWLCEEVGSERQFTEEEKQKFVELNAARRSVGLPAIESIETVPEALLAKRSLNIPVPKLNVQSSRGSSSSSPMPDRTTGLALPLPKHRLRTTMRDRGSETLTMPFPEPKLDRELSVSVENSETSESTGRERKSRWLFGRKGKEKDAEKYSEEEIKRRLRDTIGDAFLGAKGGWV